LDRILTANEVSGALQQSIREYYRLISGMDYAVGKIIEELRERGLSDNTVIIFTRTMAIHGGHGFSGKW